MLTKPAKSFEGLLWETLAESGVFCHHLLITHETLVCFQCCLVKIDGLIPLVCHGFRYYICIVTDKGQEKRTKSKDAMLVPDSQTCATSHDRNDEICKLLSMFRNYRTRSALVPNSPNLVGSHITNNSKAADRLPPPAKFIRRRTGDSNTKPTSDTLKVVDQVRSWQNTCDNDFDRVFLKLVESISEGKVTDLNEAEEMV